MVIDESTVPMFVREDDRLIVVSCNALAGCPLESSNCMKIQLYVLSSARTVVGPMKIPSWEGPLVDAEEVF